MKTNLKGLWAVASSQFIASSVARFNLFLLSCMFITSIAWGQTTYYSKAVATDFNATASWGTATDGSGTSPASISNTDNYVIQNGSIMSLTGNASVRALTINAGKLTVASNTLTISIASQNNTELNVTTGGILEVSGGTLQINGAAYFADGSSLIQSGGLIKLNPNSGTATTSIGGASATAVTFGIGYAAGSTSSTISTAANVAKFQLTGGTLQIVDPVLSTSTTCYSLAFRAPSSSGHLAFGAGHTVKYGDGVSSLGAGSTNGFYNYFYVSTAYLTVGNMICDLGNTGTNRFLNFTSSIGVLGDLTIVSGEMRTGSSTFYVAGNITNNGTLTTNGTLYLGKWTNATASASSNAQSISGTGVFRNATTTPTANYSSLTINNTSAGGVTFSTAQSLNSAAYGGSLSGTFTLVNGLINTGSNTFTLGVATGTMGTLTYTAGGFGSGSSFARWFAAAGTGTTIAAGTAPAIGVGSFPFVSGNPVSGMSARHFHRATSTFSTGGPFKVTYNDATGTAALGASFTESSITYDKQTNCNWVTSVVSPGVLSGTAAVYCIQADGAFPNTTGNVVLARAGTNAGTAQAGGSQPMGQRAGLTVANQTGTFTLALASSQLPKQTIASGKWEDGTTWSGGVAPTCADAAFVMAGHTVAIDATTGTANSASTYVNAGGTLNISGGTFNIGCSGNFYDSLVVNGTLNVSGGTTTIKGSLDINNGANFAHSAGNILIDGNNGGSTTNSVRNDKPLFGIGTYSQYTTGTITATGGKITIIDPHTSATAASSSTARSYAFYYNSTKNVDATASHTIQFGNGTSTDAGGAATGFAINTYMGSGRFNFGNLTVNDPSANPTTSKRAVVSVSYAPSIRGNFTITDGKYDMNAIGMALGGNLVVNDSLTASGTLTFANSSGTSTVIDSVAQTVSGTGVIINLNASPTANFTGLIINNQQGYGGVTFANNFTQVGAQLANTVSTTALTFTAGTATTASGVAFVNGVPGTTSGTLTRTAGGFTNGSTYGIAWTAATTGTTFTAGAVASTTTSQLPFVSSTGTERSAWINRATPSAGGVTAITYNEAAGSTSGLSIADANAYTVTTRTNDNWVVSTLGSSPAAATWGISISATNVFGTTLSADSARIVLANAAFPSATYQKGTALPHGQRIGLTLTQLTSAALYLGANSNEVPNVSVANGDWNQTSTWSKAAVPTCTDIVVISTGNTVTITGGTNNSNKVTINSGATLSQSAGTLVVGCTNNNSEFLINSGTYNVSGGTLTVNGKFTNNNVAGSLIQSGGDIIVDGNSGTLTTSINGHIVDMYALDGTKMNLTGGSFTVVDPTLSATTGNGAFKVYPSNAFTTGAGWTLKLGNGVSTDAGGNTDGFLINLTNVSSMVIGGDVIVNTQGATWAANRHVTTANAVGIKNLTITKGDYRLTSANYINGNITNNDTLSHHLSSSNLNLATYSGSAAAVCTNAQSLGGTGFFRNALTNASKTAEMIGLTVNNNNATGITLNVPLSISGTLTMTSGIINTSASNLLTLGTVSAAGTLSCTPSATNFINGPFTRTFPIRTASGTYTVATLFPVGASSSSLPMYIDPTTTAATKFTANAYATMPGTSGSGVSNLASVYWSAIPDVSSNVTSSRIQLNHAGITATSKLLYAQTNSGSYGGTPGGSSSVASTSVTAGTDISPYYNFYSYGDLVTCSAPSDQATAITLTNKTTTTFTGTLTPASSSPTGYLVVRYASGATPTAPNNNTLYAIGAAIGTGTVRANVYGTPFQFNETGLTASTTYDYYVYAFNNSGCAGPTYNLISPYLQSVTTCGTAISLPTTISASSVTITSMVINYTTSTSATVTDHILDVSTNSGFTSFVQGYQNLSLGTVGNSGAQTVSISGLSGATAYYIRIKAVDGAAGCESAYTSTFIQNTDCNAITSLPWTENFDALNIGTYSSTSNNIPTCWTGLGNGTYPFTLSNAASNTYNDPVGNTGNYLTAYYNSATKRYIYIPGIQLSAGVSYDFSFKFVGDGYSGTYSTAIVNNAKLTTGFSLLGTFNNITNTTIGGANSTAYTTYKYSYVPSITGVYYFGVTDSTNSSPFYRGFDDFKVELTPSPIITSVTSSTPCGGSTKVVITGTDLNNITTATIGGVSLLSFDSVSSTRLVKTLSTPFNGTTSISNSIGTATNATTLVFTNAPALSINSSATQLNCAGVSSTSLTTLTSNVTNYNSYVWSPSTGVSGDSSTGWTFNPATSQTYTLTVTNSSGCTNSVAKTISVGAIPSALTLTPSTTQSICAGNIQSIVASGGAIGGSFSMGPVSPTAQGGSISASAFAIGTYYQIFDVLQATTLVSIDVYPTAAVGSSGSISIANNTGTILTTVNYTVTNSSGTTPQTVVLNYPLSIGTGYRIGQGGTAINLNRNTTNQVYPVSNTYVSITGNNFNAAYWYYIYNWQISNSTQQQITWSPTTDLYTDAAATTAYTGNPTTVYSKPTANRTYTATATTSNGCTASASVTLNSSAPLASAPTSGAYVFGATTNTNYNTAANWYTYSSANGYAIASAVPTSSDIVVIPATSSCIKALPSLSATSSITDVEIQSGAILSLNGNNLSIAGTLSGAGTIKGSATSSLSFTGSASNTLKMDQTTLGTTNVLKNLTLSGTGTTTLGNALNITAGASSGSVTAGSGTTLTTAGFLTLKSDASGTARIAQSAGTISGNVTQERFVPGKAIRKWSFLASPVTQLLSSAWQQQIHITGPGTGGTMCNNYTISGTMTPHSNGFDVTQLQNPSFYTYDAATDNFVANTSGTNTFTLSPGNGYMVLVRGDRNDATNGGCVLLSANNQAAFTSIPVTLAATGTVGQGTITKVLPAGYSFIGNPYPCEIDFPSFNTTNSSVISGGYWTYYPTNATYTFSTYNNGTSTNGGTQVIANGQSFLVNSASGGTITFNEAHKSTTANNGNFRLTKTWDELLRVGLLNNQSNRLDEVVIRFGNDAAISKSINEYDAASVNAGDQWIKTMKDATELAIQTRPNTYQNDTVSLAIHAKNAGTYQLGFSEYQGLSNTEVYLIDQQENLIQNVKALPSYDFSVAANTTTANRFKLIFNAKTSGIGNIASNTQLQVYPNPTKDKVSITCNSLEYGAYQVKVRTITGAEVLQAKGFYKNGDVIELSLNDLAAGMYLLELSQDNGFRATQKITKH
jgi:Secretion system C-terminal sorting domain